jgi:hypothetical protein
MVAGGASARFAGSPSTTVSCGWSRPISRSKPLEGSGSGASGTRTTAGLAGVAGLCGGGGGSDDAAAAGCGAGVPPI